MRHKGLRREDYWRLKAQGVLADTQLMPRGGLLSR